MIISILAVLSCVAAALLVWYLLARQAKYEHERTVLLLRLLDNHKVAPKETEQEQTEEPASCTINPLALSSNDEVLYRVEAAERSTVGACQASVCQWWDDQDEREATEEDINLTLVRGRLNAPRVE